MAIKDLSHLTEGELGYLAGILDRCAFMINPNHKSTENKGSYKIKIVMSYPDNIILQWLETTIGGYLFKTRLGKYSWSILGKEAIKLIEYCYKYLKIKRRHANIFLMFKTTLRSSDNKKANPIKLFGGSWIFLTQDIIAYRQTLFEELKAINAFTPRKGFSEKYLSEGFFDKAPEPVRGLFDFTEDFDGFGEQITMKTGFFDDFLESIEE